MDLIQALEANVNIKNGIMRIAVDGKTNEIKLIVEDQRGNQMSTSTVKFTKNETFDTVYTMTKKVMFVNLS